MKKRSISLMLILVIVFSLISPTFAAAKESSAQATNASSTDGSMGSYIIKYKNVEKGKQDLGKRNKQLKKAFKHMPSHITTTLSAAEVEVLKQDTNIAYIEKDSIVKKTGDTVTNNIYQIHVPEVQSQDIFGDGVKVAILDTGINTHSPELHVAGGASFVPNDASLDDFNGHGTFVAGILAALNDNQGLVGVAPNVSLYDVKVLDDSGNGTYSQVIQGIDWAIENHMDIVSMSFTGSEYSAALEEAMQLAYSNGILLVAATGNDGATTVSYPAKFSSVIGVGAVDGNNQLASFSNTGSEVEIVAPGVSIQGLSLNNGQYTSMSGTSMAVPQVAGVAALVKSKNTSFTNQDIRNALDNSAIVLGDTNKFGYGVVNAANALGIPIQEYSPQNDQSSQSGVLPIVVHSVGSSSISSSDSSAVNNSVYQVSAVDTTYPTTYDQVALNNVNLKPDQAPFSVNTGNENISTLSGGLSLQNVDLTLPGRNGLSFSLSRMFSSDASQLYDMDVELKPVYFYQVYADHWVTYDKQDRYGNTSYAIATDRMNQVNVGFDPPTSGQVVGNPKYYIHNFGDYWLGFSSGYRYCGSGYLTSDQFSGCYNTAVAEYKNDTGKMEFYSPMYGPSSLGNYYREWSTVADPAIYTPIPQITYVYSGYFNKTIDKTFDETMFPIGKGWSWNISSIESKHGKRYLHLTGKGTYEIDGSNKLLGYPWKDLTLTSNSSVVVNGETSAYDLKSLDNTHQYFNNEGRLIEIADAYGNTIKFTYSSVSPYGKVLTGITDAIGNAISISYTTTNVTLTMGDKTVTYNKQSLWGKEFLSSVQDQVGRTTSYNYMNYNAQFNFPSNTTANQPMNNPYGLLTSISYPTGATTNYSYEGNPVTRYSGPSGYNQAYRVAKRWDQTPAGSSRTSYSSWGSSGGSSSDPCNDPNARTYSYMACNTTIPENTVFNSKTFSYSGDIGSSYSSSFSFTTTVDDGMKQMAYTNYKQYISDTVPAAYYTTSVAEKDKSSTLQKTVSMSYDTNRRLPMPDTTSVTFTNGGSSTSTAITSKRMYDDYGNVSSETDPNNVTTTYNFDGTTHLLSSVSQPKSTNQTLFVQYLRNNQGSITQISVNDANAAGTLRSQTNFGYTDGYGNINSVTVKDDNRNIVINKEYNATYGNAFLTKQWVNVTDADGGLSTLTEQMQYDKSLGKLTQYTDGKTNTTSYQYDKLGRVKLATLPDNSNVSLTYDDTNNKVTAFDQTGLTTITQWNPLGWKISEGISGSGSIKYGYDAYGRMAWSQDAKNNKTKYAYDPWNRLTQTTYPDGFAASVTYDDIHFNKTTMDAESNQTKETYDLLNRLTKKEWLKTSGNIILGSYTYDNVGNVLTSTDGKSNTTTYAYDVLSRLSSVTDAELRTTSYAYSLANKLTQVQYPDGNKQQKQYDEVGRLIKKTDPAGLIEKYYYDANSNMSKYVDRKGQIQTYGYNNRNFMTSSVSGNETISYSYDKAGRRLTMQDATGTTSYAYDPTTKRLNTMTYPDLKTINYQYDVQGNRTQMTDPFVNNTAYGYDARNRLTGVGAAINNWDASYTYKKNDLLATVQQGNGMASTYNYDGFNLTSLTQSKTGGSAVNSFSYGYDNNFNQTSKTENGVSNSFAYDKLNRIFTSSQFNEQYSYDARGNRQTLQSNNAMNLNGDSYSYDDRNRLTQVSTDDGKNVSYRYNGDGLLYERTETGVTTRYYYDGSNMIAEGTVSGGAVTLKARYERGSSGLVARIDGNGNKQYYLNNGHGDIVGLTDSAGNTLNTYSYDMWGNPITTQETVAQPFRYSGEFWDSTTNLQYLRARWYDPSMGRFINEDTYEGDINNPLSLNLYTYVKNNPLTNVDPTGHKVEGYMGIHKVFWPAYHTSIIIFVDKDSKYYNDSRFSNYDEKRDMKYVSIGAGPVDGKLVAALNRTRDKDLSIKNDMQIISKINNDDIVGKLFELENSYEKVVPPTYALFPKDDENDAYASREYNSNSFTTGTLRAAGIDVYPTPAEWTPGFSKPLPKSYFGINENSVKVNEFYDDIVRRNPIFKRFRE